jgi:RHS repeat-associated protein
VSLVILPFLFSSSRNIKISASVLFLLLSQTVYANVPGLTPGDYSVDASGSSNYTIPIAVPPGTAGLQPSLSISYNNRSGNGLLGTGWTLGGLSVITRCAATKRIDGIIDAVDFDDNDRFCIDGQRMIAISGDYGAPGTEYRTETDSFTKIISEGTMGNGPKRFKVWTKSGQVMNYGYSWQSRILAQNSDDVRIWAISRIEDKQGNYLKIFYDNKRGAGEYRPVRIEYTGNVSSSPELIPYAEVQFEYEDRDDVTTGYQGGAHFKTSKRLSSIKTYADGQLVKGYQLSYEYGAFNRSQLINFKECDATGNCFSPTLFSWMNGEVNTFTHTNLPLNEEGTRSIVAQGDYNGDGLSDFIYADINDDGQLVNGSTRTFVYLANGDGTFTYNSISLLEDEPVSSGIGFGQQLDSRNIVALGDYNGDGLSDFIYADTDKHGQIKNPRTHTFLYTSNGDGTFNHVLMPIDSDLTGTGIVAQGDFNGDGLSDFIHANIDDHGQINDPKTHTFLYTSNGDGTFNHVLMPIDSDLTGTGIVAQGDFNGDGLSDFIHANISTNRQMSAPRSDTFLYTSNGDGTFDHIHLPIDSDLGTSNIVSQGDFNGDGLSDFIHADTGDDGQIRNPKTRTFLYTSNGDGSFDHVLVPINSNQTNSNIVSGGDFNGDGLSDFIHADTDEHGQITVPRTRTYLYTSNGDGTFESVSLPIDSNLDDSNIVAQGDFNGDGFTDFIHADTNDKGQLINGTSRTYLYLNDNSLSGIVNEFTNGLGYTSNVTYTAATDSSVYTKSENATYPEIDIQAAFYLVSSVEVDDGVGGKRSNTYSYAGAKSDVNYGFLGFANMRSTDVATGTSAITTYNQKPPYVGMVSRTEQFWDNDTPVDESDDILLGQVDTTFNSLQTHSGVDVDSNFPGVLFPYASGTVKKDYELDGSLVITTTTSSTYDEFGNPTNITGTVTDGNENFTTITNNQYHNDTTDWKLARLVCAAVTQTHPSEPAVTRVSGFEYDSIGLLSREVIEPKSTDIVEPSGVSDCVTVVANNDPAYNHITMITDYVYDQFGNKETVTISGSDINSRTTTTLFDIRGQFIESITNALSHTETHTYDTRFGKRLSVTGPNGITSKLEYDSFGREVKKIGAFGTLDETETTVTRQWCHGFNGEAGNTNCPVNGALAVITQADGAPTSVVYSDALGRTIRTEIEGFDPTGQTPPIIYADTVYDALGQIEKTSRPYFAGDTIYWNSFEYDIAGRAIRSVAADGSETTTDYDGVETAITNDKGQTNTRINNARGDIIQAIDAENNITNYYYDAFSNLIVMEDSVGNPTSMSFDVRGRKVEMTDPDMGYIQYEYNVLGHMVAQTDAKNQAMTMVYDELGRLIQRNETEGTSTWVYDTTTNYADGQLNHSIGKLVSVNSAEGKAETYTYDYLGRLVYTTTTIDGVTYNTGKTYDEFGRVDTMIYPGSLHYPTGFEITNVYNNLGYLVSVTDGVTTYWQADVMNAEGQLTHFTFGNGITTQQAFNPKTGLVSAIASSTSLGTFNVQDLAYQFDTLGNLTARMDCRQSLSETFTYDVINRMTSSNLGTVDSSCEVNGVTEAKTYGYDTLGNITHKDDMGNSGQTGFYDYSGFSGPHAVDSVTVNGTTHTFTYDANGNQTQGYNFTSQLTRNQVWTSYNKPSQISQSGTTMDFYYGVNREQFKYVMTDASGTSTRINVNSYYEKNIKGTSVTYVHYIKAGAATIAMYKSKSDDSEETRYLHKDHLGSITEITDESGTVVESLSYDPHGKRRTPGWDDAVNQVFAQELSRSFTGHEYLDDLGLIHMGGRVYDPDLGRFLSADPNIQEPYNAQNLNRYSYVLNNPLSYTDPSGFFFSKLLKAIGSVIKSIVKFIATHIRSIVAIAAAAVIMSVCPACQPIAGFVSGMISSGGDLRAGLMSAMTAMAFGALHNFPTETFMGKALKVVAHGAVGGFSSMAQGGDFLSGFMSAGATQAFSLAEGFEALGGAAPGTTDFGGFDYVHNMIIASVIGGTVAVLGGGKFQNGAITAAFSRLFNDLRITYQSDRDRRLHAERVEKYIEDLRAADPFVKVIIERLENSETLYQIRVDDRRFADTSIPERNGELHTVMTFNPAMYVSHDGRLLSPYEILAHELRHLYDRDIGFNLLANDSTRNAAELRAIYVENLVRATVGLPPVRTQYYDAGGRAIGEREYMGYN